MKQATNPRASRHMLWLQAVEKGLPDPASGRIRPYTTAELAELWGVSQRTVQYGVIAARELQGRLRGVGCPV